MRKKRVCAVCGKEFVTEGPGMFLYCSEACEAEANGLTVAKIRARKESARVSAEARRLRAEKAKQLGVSYADYMQMLKDQKAEARELKRIEREQKREQKRLEREAMRMSSGFHIETYAHRETVAIPEGIARVNLEARVKGMSYGQLQAQKLVAAQRAARTANREGDRL